MSDPLLSVIVPAWQSAATIERAITSALDGAPVDVECVVVDDGSTDGTADVVAGLAAADPRIRLIPSVVNAGVSAARNLALAEVGGRWLLFLDADDQLAPGAVAALLAPTADPTVRAVIGQRVQTDGQRRWVAGIYDQPDIREPGRKSIATHPGLLSYASLSGKIFDRGLTDGLVFEGRVLGDQPWAIRALLRAGDGIVVIDDVVYEWWRPTPEDERTTITSRKVDSAARAAEMVEVARTAWTAVATEADVQLTDERARQAVRVAYLDRLIRADLGRPLRAAIARRDPATADLLLGIGRLLEDLPRDVVAASTALGGTILLPPVRGWRRLDGAARAAYRTMLRPALRADPLVLPKAVWRRLLAGRATGRVDLD